jgi:hypothetical protein
MGGPVGWRLSIGGRYDGCDRGARGVEVSLKHVAKQTLGILEASGYSAPDGTWVSACAHSSRTSAARTRKLGKLSTTASPSRTSACTSSGTSAARS